jgi:hypothetical protein
MYSDIRLPAPITTFEAPPYFEREQDFIMHRSGVHQFMSEAEGGDRQAIANPSHAKRKPKRSLHDL